jgi:hypothetical protein
MAFTSACAGDGSSSSSANKLTIQDSVGVQFSLDCSSGVCVATPANAGVSAHSCQIGGGYDIFVLLQSQILSVGAVRVTASGDLVFNEGSPARPLVCTSNAGCPNAVSTNSALSHPYTCLNGLCQDIAGDLTFGTDDVVSLCQADLPWPTGCPYILSKDYADRLAAISQNCVPGVNCTTIPPVCRRPDVPVSTPDAAPATKLDAALPPAPAPDAGDDSL